MSPESIDLRPYVRAGDGVVFTEACAEPTPLVHALLDQQHEIGPVDAFCGLSYDQRLASDDLSAIRLHSYGALGVVARVAAQGRLRVVPCHYGSLPRLFAERHLPGDVALVQVTPADSRGRHSLGIGASYMADALPHARTVIAEVNRRMPFTTGPWIAAERLDAVVETSRELIEAPDGAPGETEQAIAAHVAELVRDGDTVQMGIGALPDAILRGLSGHRDLGVHSGMISDSVLELIETGVVTGARKPVDPGLVVTASALGSRRLFDALGDLDLPVAFRAVSYTHAPETMAALGPLVAINGAIEVDLTGQVNAETVAGAHRGAIGGQVDFSRGAARGEGRSVIALASTARGGERSRIVARLDDAVVSTPRSDVDVVVTEHGAAELRGRTLAERGRALAAIADPVHRDRLTAANQALYPDP